AGDEVGVARVLPLHEDAVAAEDGGGGVALRDLLRVEIDLGVDAEAAHDPRDRIPVHLDEVAALRRCGRHLSPPFRRAATSWDDIRCAARCRAGATWAPRPSCAP